MSQRKQAALFIAGLILGLPSVFAQSPEGKKAPQNISLDSSAIEQTDSLQKTLDSIQDLKTSVERMSKKKYSDCMQAFGSDKFCGCLRDNLSVGIDFPSYIQIVTSTKEELKYETLDAKTQEVINKTLAVRDHCVTASDGVPVK